MSFKAKTILPCNKHALVGTVRAISAAARGSSLVTVEVRIDSAPELHRIDLQLHGLYTHAQEIIGSKVMAAAKLERQGDTFRATEIGSYGIEFETRAA